MAGAATNPKQQAHELIDRLSAGQASAVVNLLEAMLDPVSAALASASMDDEPTSEEEARDVVESRAAIARGEVISNDEVLTDFGLTVEDFERMGSTPLKPESRHSAR
jgi:hypothetical protein